MAPYGHLAREFENITEHWSPRVIAAANGQFVKLAKVKGELVWHAHADEDEFFLVCKGTFILRFRDGSEVVLKEGDLHVVPRGVEHLPLAPDECWLMVVEPTQTKHTCEALTNRASTIEEQSAHLR